jgi:hypothetical protein
MNLQRMTFLSILLLGVGASALHATDYRSPLNVMAGTGIQLTGSDRLLSEDGRIELTIDSDRHTVIRGIESKKLVWKTPTSGDFVELQSNGHFVQYKVDSLGEKKGIWESGAHREDIAGARFILGNEGVLKVFVLDSNGEPIQPEIWKTWKIQERPSESGHSNQDHRMNRSPQPQVPTRPQPNYRQGHRAN